MGKFLGKQYEFGKKYECALLEEVSKRLDVAVELKEQGKESESDAMFEDMKVWLENVANGLEQQLQADSIPLVDRSIFPKAGEVVADGDKVQLKVIQEEEKEKYLAVSYEYSFIKGMYKDEKFRDATWDEFISDNAYVCSIYEKKSKEYVGYCSIKNISKEEWELAIELIPEKCHKGYGSEAMSLFMRSLNKLTGRRFFRVRVEIDNHASQGLMRKLGAYPNGISEFLLHGEEIEKFQIEHKDMITDEIRKVAAEFCMDAEDILGYVLEYRFDMQSI